MPSYLQKRVNRWYAVLEIPKHLRPVFKDKPRFVQSLETETRRTADRRKLPIIAAWKTRIELAKRKLEADEKNASMGPMVLRDTTDEPEIPIHEDAAYWKRKLAKAKEGDERALILEQIEFVAWDIGSVNVDEVGQSPSQSKEAREFHALGPDCCLQRTYG